MIASEDFEMIEMISRAALAKHSVWAHYAFGIYVDDEEFCFNRNLAGFSVREAARLGAALKSHCDQLFPLRYTTRLRAADGVEIAGEIARFW